MGGVAFAEGVAGAIVSKLAEYLVAPIGRQLGYLFCYNTNIEKMKSQVQELDLEMGRLQHKILVAQNNCQVIEDHVMRWEQEAKEKKVEVEKIVFEDQKEVGKGCWKNWCLILKSRYTLGKKAMKETQVLVELVKTSSSFDTKSISRPPPPPGIVSSEQKTHRGSYVEFNSRFSVMRNVMEALKDDAVHMIGIWGMAGVGKTTMVEEVHRKVREDHMFEEVVMVVVSQEPNMLSIQGEIAQSLGLTLEGKNFLRLRAGQLRTRLAQEGKRILIIFDDVWRKLDLEEVGIPCGDDFKGCKIMLTSRNRDVYDQMKTKTVFLLEVLREEESKILFQRMVEHSPYPVDLAYEIVRECGNLPIAIAAIGGAVANKEENTWKDVLRQLKSPAPEGEYAAVYKILKVSYDFLGTEEIKKFFLLCCLFPEGFDIPIEDLLRYGMGRRLFKNTCSLQEARTKAYAHVEKLRNSNLLLRSHKGYVKMHDLVRGFALCVASKDVAEDENVFMVKFGTRLKEWPMEDSYDDFTSISLQCDEMHKLPDGLKCPSLNLLRLVQINKFPNLEFPERFFEGMHKLQVFALRSMYVPSLPPQSLQHLSNLRTLCLDYCTLGDNISMIGDLGHLEILKCAYSRIKELPREIGKLQRLNLLDLTGCIELRRIAPNVLSSLSCLQELYMRGISYRWAEQVNEIVAEHESMAGFEELKKLANLVVVDIDIPYEALPINFDFKNLENFNISISDNRPLNAWFHYVLENTLVLKANESVLVEGLINTLCSKTKNLHLEVKDLKNLPGKLEREGFSKLRSLKLISCEELVCIVNAVGQDTANVFPNLDTLHLWNLGNLESICRGQHSKQSFSVPLSSVNQSASFGKLRNLELTRCNKLKRIFSLSIARNLINLEVLEIVRCQMMEEIFSEERGDQDDQAVGSVFPHLKRLKLESLPNLVGFCKALVEVELPQLEELNLSRLTKLTTLYLGRETLASDHHQHCLFKHKVTEIQPEQILNDSISKLRRMRVDNCEQLLYVFPCNMTEQLQNLEYFEVNKCSSVKVIFDLQGSIIEEGCEVEVLTQLKEVSLTCLPQLKHILKGGLHVSLGFRNLSKLTIEDCDSLETIFPASIARGLVMLRHLNITKCQMLEAIFSNGGGEVLKIELPNLERLYLVDLPNLVGLCDTIEEFNLPQLECLKLQGVPKFVGVYPETEISGSEHHHASHLERPSFKPTVALTNVIKRLQNLRKIRVVEFDSVEVVFNLQELNSDGGCEVVALNQLTKVFLSKLPKLRHVWEEDPHITQGLQNLTSIIVQYCDSLRHLFTPSMAKILVKLKHITIIDCKLFEAIVATEGGGGEEDEECTTGEGILFPQLTTLFLKGLPNLVSLAPKAYTFNWSFMKILIMDDCGKRAETLMNELSEDNIAPKVHNLNDNSERGTSALTFSIAKIQGFQNMKKFILSGCASLRHLLTSSMAKNLVGLEVLKVLDCKLLKAIVAEEEGGEDECITEEGIFFPKLRKLFLSGLPSLLTIMPHNFNCSSLEDLTISDCGKGAEALNDILHEGEQQATSSSMGTLEVSKMSNTVFPMNVIPRLHNLDSVLVEKCSSLEVVFDFQGLDVNGGPELVALRNMTLIGLPKLASIWKMGLHNMQGFQNLFYLKVEGCDNLRRLFTPSVSKYLVRLGILQIKECKLLEAIVAEEEGGVEKEEECAKIPTVLFPKLTKVSLHGLPNLMTITPKAFRVEWTYVDLDAVRCGEGADVLNDIILNREKDKISNRTEEDISKSMARIGGFASR